jgi:hypothetical protein
MLQTFGLENKRKISQISNKKKSYTATNSLLKGLSHEIDFKNFDKKLHNLATWLGQDQDYLGESPEWLYRYLLLL